MREERRQRREQQGTAKISLNQGGKSGKIVIEGEHLHASFGDNVVIDDFSCKILRGDKVGIIRPQWLWQINTDQNTYRRIPSQFQAK